MNIMRKTSILSCIAVAVLGLASHSYAGYSLNPMITILDLSKKQTSAEVIIQFEGDIKAPTAVELKVMGREISLDGAKVEYLDDNSANNFMIYPAQIVLMPGEKQRVQVKWVGDSLPLKETAYALIAEEAPIKIGDEDDVRTKAEARLIVRTRYEGIIVLRPAGIRPSIKIESAGHKPDSLGNPLLRLMLSNTGSALQNLKGMQLRIVAVNKNGSLAAGKSVTYSPDLTKAQTKHSIFAGNKRVIDIPWPKEIPVGPVRVTVDFPKVDQ